MPPFAAVIASAPSHGENRGSSPLGSANEINVLEETAGFANGDISNFSPTGGPQK